MTDRFQRTKMLIGDDSFKKLSRAHVIVFGIGGVGGYATEALVRAGVEKIDIVDNDLVNITNLNRQIIALNSTLGQYKVDIMEKRILDINSNAKVGKYKLFFNSENSKEFDFSKYDYIIDAIDTVKSKLELIKCAKKANTPIISSMGTGNKLNPLKFEISDISKTSVCPLARVMRYELKKMNIKKVKVLYSKETPKKTGSNTPSSISFVPSVAGLIIAGEVIRDIIKTN